MRERSRQQTQTGSQTRRHGAAAYLDGGALLCVTLALGSLPAAAAEAARKLEDEPEPATPMTYILVVALVCCSGLFSGLTLGLMGLDVVELEAVTRGGNEANKRNAEAILPIRRNGNQLLCTLLLGNVVVNAMLAIELAKIFSEGIGLLISTALITVFGEIVPQATCNRYALAVGAATACPVRVIMALMCPITLPMAKVLDMALGKDLGEILDKQELMGMFQTYAEESRSALDSEQSKIMIGALELEEKTVADLMTPYTDVYKLAEETALDFEKITDIFNTGFSRIPVWGGNVNNVVGLLYTKDLILVDPDDAYEVKNLLKNFDRVGNVLALDPQSKLMEAMAMFKKERTHLAVVKKLVEQSKDDPKDPHYEIVGILTLEDVVEALLQDDIEDETDRDRSRAGRWSGRGYNMQQLRMMSGHTEVYNRLTKEMVTAISSHLSANVKLLENLRRPTADGVHETEKVTSEEMEELIRRSLLLTHSGEQSTTELKRNRSLGPEDEDEEEGADHTPNTVDQREDLSYWLPKLRAPQPAMLLVQSGKLEVYAGHERFRSEQGPWSVLSPEALLHPTGEYKPDYEAAFCGQTVQCLVIERSLFEEVCGAPGVPNPSGPTPSLNIPIRRASSSGGFKHLTPRGAMRRKSRSKSKADISTTAASTSSENVTIAVADDQPSSESKS